VDILLFAEKTDSVIRLTFSGIIRETGIQTLEYLNKVLPLSVFTILIPIISFVTIFAYKNRKIQMRLVKTLIIFIIAFIATSGIYSFMIIKGFGASIIPGLKMAIPVLILILAFLALRGIKKDDILVKSYDRLR
jgi:hypothetical protein